MNSDRVAVRGTEPVRLTAGIIIDLNIIATCYGLLVHIELGHLGDVNAVPIDADSIGQRVGAPIAAVDDEVHYLAPRRPLLFAPTRHGPSHGIAHQRLVAIAVDEHPLLGFGGSFVGRAAHHVVALAVVVLHAEGLVLVGGRVVATDAEQDGIVLNHRAAFVDEQRLRLEVHAPLGGQDVVLHVNAERGQVCNLIELAVVALAGVAEEFQLSDVGVRT